MNFISIKQQLYLHCTNYIKHRISSIKQAIEAARQASEDDTKSSAGDKYETTREMMQQETSRNTLQLDEAGKLQVLLNRIKTDAPAASAAVQGSLVITDQGSFYIAIGAGSITIDGLLYHTISAVSPIALTMKNRNAGDNFKFNGKIYTIQAIA